MQQGATTNPHGFGFAIIAGDKIISERTMSAKRSIARFLMFREQYPDSYAIWHSRIATHGVKNEQNCHPFQVGGSPITYLAHNGMLNVDQPKDDRKSDSRVFAEQVLPAMGGVCALDNPTVFDMVSKWATGSKLAILTLDPNAERQLYIINEKSGSWDDNHVWWSNTRHRPSLVYNWEGRGASSWESQNRTRVRSVFNPATQVWEKPEGGVITYRAWKSGDIWDNDLKCYQTPLPGTVGASNLLYLPAVRDTVADALDALQSEGGTTDEEDEFDEILVICPYCGKECDADRDPNYCLWCNLCYDCGGHRSSCMCYIPQGGWFGHSRFAY